MPRVLFVEDDEALRVTQCLYLQEEGLQVTAVADRKAARAALDRDRFDLVVTDLRLGADNGLEVLRDARRLQPDTEVLVITGYGSVAGAVAAMKEGAYDYLTKPVAPEDLLRTIHKALERRTLKRQVSNLQDRLAAEAGLDRIVAVSPVMREILASIDDVAASDAAVLIEGESGTGKELLAKLIHERSGRGAGRLVSVNCGAMPENLLESELFGHVRGAFTGAHRDKPGLFEAADGGTLFLDEIGELSPAFQVKLLRVLQERRIRRVGDVRERAVDVRIVSASNRPLADMIRDGRFRRDLYFRIRVVPILLPPLRERKEDILPLAATFLKRLGQRMGRQPPGLTEAAKIRLLAHGWPGNVRELENTLERALIFCKDRLLDGRHLMLESALGDPASANMGDPGQDWTLTLAAVEQRHILNTLASCGNNKVETARLLGIGYNTLWRKLKQYRVAEASAK